MKMTENFICSTIINNYAFFSHLWMFTSFVMVFIVQLVSVTSQNARPFPPIYNVAKNRPVYTSPSDSTCGVPTRNAYCVSNVLPSSVDQCHQDFCVQACPYRTALPNFNDLLISTSDGFGQCVLTDTVNTKPNSRTGEFSVFFLKSGPTCHLKPSTTVDLGSDGAFTITFWFWFDTLNSGSLLQKVASITKEIILEVLLANKQISVIYKSTKGVATVTLDEIFPLRTWTHVAIQVYRTTISFYVNDVLPGFSPVQTFTLVSEIQDGPGITRVGQNSAGGDQFLGRIQDFKFYQKTLSNREIQEVFSGSLPPLRIQTNCRCPPSHPRVKPSRPHFCIKNGVSDNDVDDTSRLNNEAHNLEFVNDGDSNTIWISKLQNVVNLTVELGDDFQVFYVELQFYSPLPKAVVIERQLNGSDEWKVWQMYAENCLTYFSQVNNGPLASPDSVNCIQFGTDIDSVPYSNGNITFILLSSGPVVRPNYKNFHGTPELQEFVTAAKVRVRLRDHYYVQAIRHGYFGVYDMVVKGWCDCHGHAAICDTSELPYKCQCSADSFAEGDKCDRCQPLYNNKPFRRGDQVNPYNCQPCECHGHADSCVYREDLDLFPWDHNLGGGGMCQNCTHNTTGRFCDTCVAMYYRPIGKSKYDVDMCTTCDCYEGGVTGSMDCQKDGGQCTCKAHASGRTCDRCTDGFYNLQSSNPDGCDNCSCDISGTVNGSVSCHYLSGQCNCKQNVKGAKCDSCQFGFYALSHSDPFGCFACECNPQGSTSQFCDPGSGQCRCKDHITGRKCDRCAEGFQNFNSGCKPCQCNVLGTIANTICDHDTGQCICKENVQGIQCNECKDGTYGFGTSAVEGCQHCVCDLAGTVNSSLVCDKDTGNCICKKNVDGKTCNKCKGNTFGLKVDNELGCDPCNCDPTGTEGGDTNLPSDLSCNQNTGNCSCLAKRVGRRCETCMDNYFKNYKPGGGCDRCGCNLYTTIPQTSCDKNNGQCHCKENAGVTGRTCTSCQVGFFNFQALDGCSLCECDTAGSINDTCHITTGQCSCKQFVIGRRCDKCSLGSSYLDPDNPFGCSKDPAQQPPPEHESLSASEISLKWRDPDYVNGIIIKYRLFRNGTLIFIGNGTDQNYLDTGLSAYTRYTYVVEATNDFGFTQSAPVTFRTQPGAPTGIVIVEISNILSTSAMVTWTPPAKLNGPLDKYTVSSTTPVQPNTKLIHWTGTTRGTNLTNLVPYMNYTIMVVTCSTGGCLNSLEKSFTTHSALPAGMKAPKVVTLTSAEIYVEWSPPTHANGIIIFYELWMRGELQQDGTRSPMERRIFNPSGQFNPRPTLAPMENVLPPPDTNYTVRGLASYTVYEFQVLAENDIGKTASPWVAAKTGEDIPVFMPSPYIQPISSSELQLSWRMPSDKDARGIIASYRIYQYEQSDLVKDPFSPPFIWKLIATTPGSSKSHLLDTLVPFTNYTFKVGACNSVGCVNSSEATESTLQDDFQFSVENNSVTLRSAFSLQQCPVFQRDSKNVPQGLQKPKLRTVNSTMIEVSWKEPTELNGPAPVYSVEKTVPSLSFPPIITEGTRFPGGGYYLFPPEVLPYDVDFTGIRFQFRTRKPSSLLFFAASSGRQDEFVVIQFKSGRPWFLFDPQDCYTNITVDIETDKNQTYHDNQWHSLFAIRDREYSRLVMDGVFQGCPSFVTPTNDEGLPYNDGRWHKLTVFRSERMANISVDSYWRGTKEQKACNSSTGTVIGQSTGVYIGGLPKDFVIRRDQKSDQRMAVIEESFIGCIKNIEILTQMYPTQVWTPVNWNLALQNEQAFLNWEGCPENLDSEDDATHFHGEGFVSVLGTVFQMYDTSILEFKFRTDLGSGMLFFAHGAQGVYFFIALISNSLYFEFSNNKATGSVTFIDPNVTFCSGEWHSVSIEKHGQKGTIKVNGVGEAVSGDQNFRMFVITYSDLYIGGVPQNSRAMDFIVKHKLNIPLQGFGGCLKEMKLTLFYPAFHTKKLSITESLVDLANANMDGCNPYALPLTTCKGDLVQNVYNGTDTFYIDAGLQPYSDYLYRILASNEGGIGVSGWKYARTREGAPQGVKPPYNVSVLSGYVIEAEWEAPVSSSGLLSKYILRAYSEDDPTHNPVEAEFTDLRRYKGQITTAVPYTNYIVKIAICTGGGCSESLTGVKVTTMEEAPQDVYSPTADAGVSFLNVKWTLPGKPNGIITGFILYHDDKEEIYSGAQRSHNLTGLQVYTAYQFTLRACTRVGCTASPSVSLRTAQLPPTFVKAPVLIALETTKVEARWEKPKQLNGVLERYLLYVSTDNATLGAVVYESADFFLYNEITHLVAGTTYYVTLAACTAGGCTTSEYSVVTTKEGTPQGVHSPTLTSFSPSELTVNWQLPQLPNGNLLRYDLFHNEVKVYSGLGMNFTITNLAPYSLQTVRLEACTIKGCGSSTMVTGRTMEAPPTGYVVMEMKVKDPRTVEVKWSPPTKENGIIFYDVYCDGNFYLDPDNFNFSLVQDRLSLFRGHNVSVWVDVFTLIPLTSYKIQVNASNTVGYVLSNMLTANMPMGTPDGVIPPLLISETSTSILVTWKPVGRGNSLDDPLYTIQFRDLTYNGSTVYDIFGPTTTFLHTKHGLKPYTEYEFRVMASNSLGKSYSPWVKQFTRQDKPEIFDPPLIGAVGSRYIDITWQRPLVANGVIKEYKIYQNGNFREKVSGNSSTLRADTLLPFTPYVFAVEACTLGGCRKTAGSSTVRTLEDVPEGMGMPRLRSLTPTTVEVKWSTPTTPNGIINEYVIERRLSESQLVTSVGKVLPTTQLVFVDESSDLSPFTPYEYRVKVSNNAGSVFSAWETIKTKSTRPAGVMPPGVEILGPTSMRIIWQPPLKLNGILEYYVVSLPYPRREIRNTTTLSITVENLDPFKVFSVILTACTDGGCTESSPVLTRTDPTIPENLPPPIPLVISQTLITITWQDPEKANGPNVRFELARMKLKQPLEDTAVDLNIWRSLYTGTAKYYEDRGLPIFTTYVYRVTVYNDVGQLTSDPCLAVTTHGGFPRKAADVTVIAIDHITLKVSWSTPNVTMLQGDVSKFTVSTVSKLDQISESYPPGTNNVTVGNLTPNTVYIVRVTITVHGGETITSLPITGTTLDGAPEGVLPPSVTVLSETSVRVSWSAPQTPNGQIIGYNIYVNMDRTPTNMAIVGSYVLTKLQPYTVYSILIEVCTIFDCSRSDAVLVTTAEALPQGLTPPFVVSDSPTTVDITWTEPIQPNGILLQYELYRTTIKKCSEIPLSTMSPELTKCTYVECPVLQSVCGSTCFTGPKVCCGGKLHDSKDNFECCDTKYLEKPSQNAVCCGGKFHLLQDNHQCCGHRYVRVLPDQVCCLDSIEDRVTVGYGDSCCKDVPYSTNGAQICCKGRLSSGYKKQCCGNEIISSDLVCCGNLTSGKAYTNKTDHVCCGEEYNAADLSLCCTSDTGHTKVHIYPNVNATTAANEKCCGIEKISSSLQCCNYIGYNPATHVCADTSSMQNGCGYGTICPIASSATAYCDRCDFNKSSQYCGFRTGYHGNIPMPTTPDPIDDCILSEDRIYYGVNMSFSDEGLEPYSVYQYTISVVNSAGDTRSGASQVTTKQWFPEGVAPPKAAVNPTQLYAIHLTWNLPKKPNGEILRYILTRDGIELYRGLEKKYTDDTTILPYRSYSYFLTACTVAGCSTSDAISVATAEGKPDEMMSPEINSVTSRSFHVTWKSPAKPNGIIKHYLLTLTHSDGTSIMNKISPNVFSYQYKNLLPYSNYTVEITACTDIGCTKSPAVSKVTLQDSPEGISPPRLVVVSSTSLLVFWNPPRRLNGPLKLYAVMRVWSMGAKQIYFGVGYSMEDNGLKSGVEYKYYLIVGNGIQNISSSMVHVTMPSNFNVNVPKARKVQALSSSSIYVEWDPVVPAEGSVDQYGVILNAGRDTEVETRVGLNLSAIITDLRPYMEYSTRLVVCIGGISNGCGLGPSVTVRTHEAPPTGLSAPMVTVISSNVVDVKWKPPVNPNGVITQYLVYYRELGSRVDLLINRVDVYILSVRHAGQDLRPYTQYQYKVIVSNSKGDVSSPWTTIRTLEASPKQMPRPTFNSTHAFGFGLSWQPPVQPNGKIIKYRVTYRLVGNDPSLQNHLSFVDVSPMSLYTRVSGLTPYSNYEVFITAFNSVGNITSGWTIVQTGQTSPAGLQNFEVEKISSGTSVILRWDPPSFPYGIIVSYRIYETGSDIALYDGLNPEFEFRRLQPYTQYYVNLEACTQAGCTMGNSQSFITLETVPSDQSGPTMGSVNSSSVQITWSRPVHANGVITKYEVLRQSQVIRSVQKRSFTDAVVVFRTSETDKDSYQFTDLNLKPFTEYQYSIRASNSKGSTQSPWQSIVTAQDAPESISPPLISYINNVVDQLKITWVPPTFANGILQNYQLQRNNSIPFSFSVEDALEYVDINLTPYTVYSYTVTVCTVGGCTTSEPTLIRTKEVAPVSVKPPSLFPVNSSAIRATWESPSSSNGEITQFRLLVNRKVVYTGLANSHVELGLIPFQEYSFSLRACTSGGCTESGEVVARPDDDAPASMPSPILNVLSSKSIEISWQAPLFPNGIITSYDIRRNGTLVYTESVSISGKLRTTYTDFSLMPGTTYSFVIIARNRKGSVESGPSSAVTYSASPSGLEPPTVQALSSTSIQVKWQPPAYPNGVIKNYTLFLNNKIIHSVGTNIFSYEVPGLEFWTEYSFRIQACTERGCELSGTSTTKTLESTPEEQGPPTLLALANDKGAHAGVQMMWEEPTRPNGIILRYEVFRREVKKEKIGSSYGPVIEVYNGKRLRYSDYDGRVKPYTEYEYSVSSANSIGKAEGPWASIFTKEGPPDAVKPPTIQEISTTTISVLITPPVTPNGVIRYYNVLYNGTVGSSSVDLSQTIGLNTVLKPFTVYMIHVVACTAGGCTESAAVDVRTRSSKPTGQAPVTVKAANNVSVTVSWNYPTQPNGDIISFMLYKRLACPLTSQPFSQACQVGQASKTFDGLALEYTVTNLLPYTAYEFQILSENQAGITDYPSWIRGETTQSVPLYIQFPLLSLNNSLAVVDWSGSFELHGRLREYILIVGGRVVFRGITNVYQADKQTSAAAFSLMVSVVTDEGQAESPSIVFDPNAINHIGTSLKPEKVVVTEPQIVFYQEVWFIVLLILVSVLLIFVIVAICLRQVGGRRPYIREGASLSERQHKSIEPFPFFDDSSGSSSIMDTEMSSRLYRNNRDLYNLSATNTTYSPSDRKLTHLDIPSRTASHLMDDDFLQDDDFLWKKPVDGRLAFNDDEDSVIVPSYSVMKEQTVFTDTHV